MPCQVSPAAPAYARTGRHNLFRDKRSVCIARASATTASQESQRQGTPLLDAVLLRGSTLQDKPFHVPGHKRGRALDSGMQQLLGIASVDGHQNPLRCDLTELAGLDYLSAPTGVIAEAQQAAAAAFDADQTWFLVNGCSVGIHAAVMATVKPGQTILLARNCHLSAFSACVITGCQPLWLAPTEDEVHGVAHCITPEQLTAGFQAAKAQGLSAGAVMVVSPTYYGAVARISELAAICHAEGVPLLVDEAHGGHLNFISSAFSHKLVNRHAPDNTGSYDCNDSNSTRGYNSNHSGTAVTSPQKSVDDSSNFGKTAAVEQQHKQPTSNIPPGRANIHRSISSSNQCDSRSVPMSALSSGADVVVHSSHKVLTAMTQAAMLHLKGSRVHPDRISKALQVLQTSSPSYILLSSLDAARRHATTPTNWSTPLAAEASARRGLVKVSSQCNNCLTLLQRGSCGSEESIEGFDPLRLVVNVQDLGLKGYAAAAWLEEKHGIVSELATSQLVVFVLGPGSTLDDSDALVAAFEDLCTTQLSQLASSHHSTSSTTSSGSNSRDLGCKQKVQDSSSTSLPHHSTSSLQHQHLSFQQPYPKAALSPREAFFADTECIGLAEAAGRISAELLCPYPPGVPLLFPGEVVTTEVIWQLQDTIAQGGVVTGALDSSLKALLVVATGS